MDAVFWDEGSGSVWDPEDEGSDGEAVSSGSKNISHRSESFSVTE